MGLRPPWGQSLLRSCLAAHSFPPPPPAYVLSAVGMPITPNGFAETSRFAASPKRLDSQWRPANRNLARTHRAKPHHAGGRRGKERAARHERSSDWRRGAQRPRPVLKRLVQLAAWGTTGERVLS